jgi:hypothetical protein
MLLITEIDARRIWSFRAKSLANSPDFVHAYSFQLSILARFQASMSSNRLMVVMAVSQKSTMTAAPT